MNNAGKSFTDRDVVTPATIDNIRWADNWNLTVAPHIESTTNDIFVYKPEFSNLVGDEKSQKFVVTEYTVKDGGSKGYGSFYRYISFFTNAGLSWKTSIYKM